MFALYSDNGSGAIHFGIMFTVIHVKRQYFGDGSNTQRKLLAIKYVH